LQVNVESVQTDGKMIMASQFGTDVVQETHLELSDEEGEIATSIKVRLRTENWSKADF